MHFINILIFSILVVLNISVNSKENEILFEINNKIYTSNDLENRKKFLILENRLTNSTNPIDDLISIILYSEEFDRRRLQLNEELIKKYYLDIKNNVSKLDNDSNQIIIFDNMSEKIILEQIIFDYKRKVLIENELNKKKDIILNYDLNNNENIYDIFIQLFTVKRTEKIEQSLNEINLTTEKIDNIKKILKMNNIIYFYSEKNIIDLNNLDKKLFSLIIDGAKNFNYNQNEMIYFGKINRKIKYNTNINYLILQLSTELKLTEIELKCDEIKKTAENKKLKIKEINYSYSKLNNKIKENLIRINDLIVFKENNLFKYLILCKIDLDEKAIKDISINQKIFYFADQIERDFVKMAKDRYNFKNIKLYE